MKIKNEIDKRFNTLRNPDWSVVTILTIKMKILFQLFSQCLKHIRGLSSLSKLRSFRNTGKESYALVLGNGPIEEELPYEILSRIKKEGRLYIYGVNFILNSEMADKLRVDYLVLSDPETLDLSSMNKRVIELWGNIRKFKPKIFVPFTYHKELKNYLKYSEDIYFFNDLSIETIGHNINPLFPRSYPSSTLLKALAISIFAKHDHIFITGADQSMFTKIYVNEENMLKQFPSHRKGAEGGNDNHIIGADVTNAYLNGLADYLFDMSNLHLAFSHHFKNADKINYIGNSYHDFYKKISVKDFVKKILSI